MPCFLSWLQSRWKIHTQLLAVKSIWNSLQNFLSVEHFDCFLIYMTGFPWALRFFGPHLCRYVEKFQQLQLCVCDQWLLTLFVDVSKFCWIGFNELLGVHTVSSPDFPFLLLSVFNSFHLTIVCWETCWTCWANCDDAAEIKSSSFLLWQQTTGFYFAWNKRNSAPEMISTIFMVTQTMGPTVGEDARKRSIK